MTHKEVESSFIESIGHDEEAGLMEIKMRSGVTYTHENVTKQQYDAFVNAPSVGQHYNRHFKK